LPSPLTSRAATKLSMSEKVGYST